MASNGSQSPIQEKARRPRTERLKFRQDHRARLPAAISRFLGYRPLDSKAPFEPIPFPPFSWLKHVPLKYEIWLFTWVGAFGGILLIEAIMSTSTAFRDVYHTPTIITSFGASSVLVFGAIESPLAQPRNFVLGHFVSALAGTCITRLFVLDPRYQEGLDNRQFHANTFINGGLSTATAALGQFVIGAVHPQAGATGLNAAVQSQVVSLSWCYLPTMLASSLIMLGWALIINNLGRRRYPTFWWEPESRWVAKKAVESPAGEEEAIAMEAGGLSREDDTV